VQLLIEITDQRLSAFSLNGEQINRLADIACLLKNDLAYKDNLQELIKEVGSLDRFDEFTCSYSSPYFSMVPASLFAASNPEELLQFTVADPLPKGETDYNRLPEWNMVVLYHMPLWVKTVLFPKVPRIMIQHEMSHVLRYMNSGSTFGGKTVIVIQEDHFSCMVRNNGQIAHASVQEFQEPQDIAYHVLNTLQKVELTGTHEIIISATIEKQAQKGRELVELFNRIAFFSGHRFHYKHQFHLQFQALCV
jgi:hypothetical protein